MISFFLGIHILKTIINKIHNDFNKKIKINRGATLLPSSLSLSFGLVASDLVAARGWGFLRAMELGSKAFMFFFSKEVIIGLSNRSDLSLEELSLLPLKQLQQTELLSYSVAAPLQWTSSMVSPRLRFSIRLWRRWKTARKSGGGGYICWIWNKKQRND